jgi:hypothetical protein
MAATSDVHLNVRGRTGSGSTPSSAAASSRSAALVSPQFGRGSASDVSTGYQQSDGGGRRPLLQPEKQEDSGCWQHPTRYQLIRYGEMHDPLMLLRLCCVWL